MIIYIFTQYIYGTLIIVNVIEYKKNTTISLFYQWMQPTIHYVMRYCVLRRRKLSFKFTLIKNRKCVR